jgi:hypothetical protein
MSNMTERRLSFAAAFIMVAFVACGGATKPDSARVSTPEDPAFATVSSAPEAQVSSTVPPALAGGLAETAAWFAPGMTADGPAFTASLGEKGHARAAVTLHAGKCYAVVGFSPQGQVTDFDLRLWKTSPPAILAEDDDDDTTPTIGKPPICPEADTSYVLDLYADKGKGDVVVQGYSKAR